VSARGLSDPVAIVPTALFASLRSLTPADLDRDVLIRGEPLSVVDAIERQKEHYAYHVGQIVFLAKHLMGADWRNLSIPRGQSEQFHAERRARGDRRGFRQPRPAYRTCARLVDSKLTTPQEPGRQPPSAAWADAATMSPAACPPRGRSAAWDS
jgi:hypothetical protein